MVLDQEAASVKPRAKGLYFIPHYTPGVKYGGPIRSLANMLAVLSNYLEACVVTADRDLGDVEPYQGVPFNTPVEAEDCTAFYMTADREGLVALHRLIKAGGYTFAYFNSFFSPLSTLVPLLLIRWLSATKTTRPIVAPRGEFNQGALAIKSLKKRAYILAFRWLGLHRNVTWHSTNEAESMQIRGLFGSGSRIVELRNLSAPPDANVSPPVRTPNAPLRLIYIARVARIKNLAYVLEALRGCSAPIMLSIFGPAEDDRYWQDCKAIIETLPANVTVHYKGVLANADVPSHLAAHHVFVLPSRGENYGHAIVEALAAGRPVVITDRTPWIDIEAYQAGWIVPLDDVQAFTELLEEVASVYGSDLDAYAKGAQEYYASRVRENKLEQGYKALFLGHY